MTLNQMMSFLAPVVFFTKQKCLLAISEKPIYLPLSLDSLQTKLNLMIKDIGEEATNKYIHI